MEAKTIEQAAIKSRKEVEASGESYDFWAKKGMSFRKNGDTSIAYRHGFIKGAEYAAQQTAQLQQENKELKEQLEAANEALTAAYLSGAADAKAEIEILKEALQAAKFELETFIPVTDVELLKKITNALNQTEK